MVDATQLKAERILRRDAAKKERPPVWVDATELTEEEEPNREWVVEGLLERQGRILLAGAEGCGKSLLALTLGVQVAAGLPPLVRFPATDPRAVVYLDLEMARSSTRRRLRAMEHQARAEGKALEAGSLLLCLRPDGLNLGSPREQRDLQAQIEKAEPELVIVDPLYKLTLTDSVYEREIKPTLQFLDRIRLEHGSGLILVHHLRKRSHGEGARGRDASDIFGSSVLLRWPETTFILTDDSLRVQKDRDDTFDGKRSWPVTHGPMWPIGLGEPRHAGEQEVEDYLAHMGSASGNQIARDVTGRRKDLLDAISRLEKQGRIVRRQNRWELAE